ncbi:MAG: hypothetical protein M3373_10375 [Gemmatimonadota bacterium]|nr:hypothetical protein [Gemmatimonadota bacterium]
MNAGFGARFVAFFATFLEAPRAFLAVLPPLLALAPRAPAFRAVPPVFFAVLFFALLPRAELLAPPLLEPPFLAVAIDVSPEG